MTLLIYMCIPPSSTCMSFGTHFLSSPCTPYLYPYLYPSFLPVTPSMYPFSSTYPPISNPVSNVHICLFYLTCTQLQLLWNNLHMVSSKPDQPVVFYLDWLSWTRIRMCYDYTNSVCDNTSIVSVLKRWNIIVIP